MIQYFSYDRRIAKYKDRYAQAYQFGLDTISDIFKAGAKLTPSRQALADKCKDLSLIPNWTFCHCGSDALQLAISALSNPGDKVIIPAWCHIAAPQATAWINRQIIFCDVGTDGLICPKSFQKVSEEHPDAKIVIAVHMNGRICDVQALKNINPSIKIIEDAANSFYFPHFDCEKPGVYSDAYCCSFDMAKSPGGTGTGGAVGSYNQEFIDKISSISQQGLSKDRSSVINLGRKSSLDDTSARVILEDIKIIEEYQLHQRKRHNFIRLTKGIDRETLTGKNNAHYLYDFFPKKMSASEAAKFFVSKNVKPVYNLSTITCFPDTSLFKNCSSTGHSYAKRIAEECIMLPCHEFLSDDEIDLLIEIANQT
jgi:dTDP-4-amino-4,6-dideoxygalactose transaminase